MDTQTKVGTRRESKLGRWIGLAVVLAIAAGAYWYWLGNQGFESTDDAQIDARIHSISSRVSGTVLKIYVEDNQFVEAGTVLAELDPRPYQVKVEQAKASLAEAQAEAAASRTNVPVVTTATTTQLSGAQAAVEEVRTAIATAEQQVTAARARVPVLEAQLRQAEANHDRAARDLERYQALVAKEEISRQQFDAARSTEAATKAQVETAQAQLQEAQRMIEVAERQVAQQQSRLARAQADVQAAAAGPQQVSASQARVQAAGAKVQTEQADLSQAQLDLEFTKIVAPVSGIVRRNVEIGQAVQNGQPVMTVVPLNETWVEANFKENQLARIKPGQPVEIAVDAYGGKTYKGKVESISPATGARFSLLPPENATGNYVKVVQRITVKITFEAGQDPEHTLRPGMSVVPRVRVQ